MALNLLRFLLGEVASALLGVLRAGGGRVEASQARHKLVSHMGRSLREKWSNSVGREILGERAAKAVSEVDRDSATRRARRLDVQSDVGRNFTWFVGREAVPAFISFGTTGALVDV